MKNPLRQIKRCFTNAVTDAVLSFGKARMPDGRWYDVPKTMDRGDYRGLWTGRYESPEVQVLCENFIPSKAIIEIGSNLGVVSRSAMSKVLQGGSLVLVEPNPRTLPHLKTNIAREAKPDVSVIFVEAAVGCPAIDGERQKFFSRPTLDSGLASNLVYQGRGDIIDVPVRSLGSLVQNYANGSRFSLIIDGEGVEYDLFRKDPNAFRNCDQILGELHRPHLTGREGDTPDKLIEDICKLGFEHRRAIADTHYFCRPH